MFRNLNAWALGITGRQSELIELALTYGFSGLDVDLGAIVKRARSVGVEQAQRFLASARVSVGEFTLPVSLSDDEAAFRSSLERLEEVAEVAASVDALRCRVPIAPLTDGGPYHEHFEMHRRRLAEVADVLARHNIRLGLAFTAIGGGNDAEISFIRDGESLMTLIKNVGKPNIGVALDTWHWFVAGGTLDQIKAIPLPSIVAVRLADFPTAADPPKLTDRDRLLPYEGGGVDCHAVVQHLREFGYEGPLTLYPSPACSLGKTREAIVQQAKATFDRLLCPAPATGDEVAEEVAEDVDSVSTEAS